MRKLSFVGSLLLVFISSFVSASPLFEFKLPIQEQTSVSFDRYDVYYGDFDGDFYQDLYFHGIVSETSVGAVGEEQLPPPGFAYFGMFEGYQTASPWDMTGKSLDECRTCSKAEPNVDYLLGDMDGDGIPDMLVKGRDASQSSLLISGVDDGGLPRILLEILPTGNLRVPGQDPGRESYFRNNLRDADVSIVDGQLVVDGVSHGLNQMRFAAGRNQSATAKSLAPQSLATLKGGSVSPFNISTPPTPSLPSHSLTAAQINDIDALSSLGGEFRVNEAGAATYTVPLSLPAGTAGVAPEITLFYSSQAGVGDMGLGWSMQAGGAITRCRQTLQQDGVALPIQFTESDRFCLNGQRLLVISGVYGSTGAQYKTEIDSGVHVTSVGGSNGHPDYFEVRDKDGSVSRYGGSGNHNSEQRGRNAAGALLTNRTFNWNLSEFKDSVGNKVVYAYQSAASYFRLSSVSYGYGSSTTPDVQVTFHYGVRKKSEIEWVMDSRFEASSLLAGIQVHDKNSLVREYKIRYEQEEDSADHHLVDQVTSIQSCIGDICGKPLKLSWGTPSPGAASRGNGKVTGYTKHLFNFDYGPTVFTTNGHPEERIATGDKDIKSWSVIDSPVMFTGPGRFLHSYLEADINGDGRSDLVVVMGDSVGNYSMSVLRQTDRGFARPESGYILPGDPNASGGAQAPRIFPVDFNADGRMDVAVYLPALQAWRTYFSEPQTDGTWRLVQVNGFLPANVPNTLRFADVNSDGLMDLVYIRENQLYAHYLKRTGADTSSRAYSYSASHDSKVNLPTYSSVQGWGFDIQGTPDFNGDGRADFWISSLAAVQSPVASTCFIGVNFLRLLSKEDGDFSASIWSGGNVEYVTSQSCLDLVQDGQGYHEKIIGPVMNDIDGDGILDVIWARKSADDDHTREIVYRLGASNDQFGPLRALYLDFDAYGFELLDTDSDGDMDLLLMGQHDERRVARWRGTGFETPTFLAGGEVGRQTRYTDIDGDGNIDRLVIKDGKLTVTRGVPKVNNVVVRFETGLGALTGVAYEPLRDSGRYTVLSGIDVTQTGIIEGHTRCHAPPELGGCAYYPPTPIMAVDADEFYRKINDPFAAVDSETDLELYKGVPAQEFISTMPVVTRVVSSAPTAANADQLAGVDYSYEGLKIQAGGRGMLGFKKLTTTDMQTGVTTTTEYRQDWPFMGTPVRTTTMTHNGQLLSESTSKMRIHGITSSNIASKRTLAKQGTSKLGPLVLYTQESRDIAYSAPQELLAMPGTGQTTTSPSTVKLKEIVTTTEVDAHGNATRIQVETLGTYGAVIHAQTTENTYYPGDGERLGRLQRSVVTTSRPSVATQIKAAEFTYYGYPGAPGACSGAHLVGLLCSEQVTADDLTNSVQPAISLHFYDLHGNKTHTRTGTRVSPFAQYDAKGRFVQATYDVFANGALTGDATPSGYSAPSSSVTIKTTEVLERDKFGTALRSRVRVGQNSWLDQVQSTTSFGTVFFKGDSTGAFEQTHLQGTADPNCPSTTAFTKTVTAAGGAQATECYDKLGRILGGYKPSLQGGTVRTQQDYDALGRVIRVYEPAFGAPAHSTDTVYDVLGRPTHVTHPFFVTDANGVESSTLATTRYVYSGSWTTTYHSGHTGNPERSRTEITNLLGELFIVLENGRGIRYDYDAVGNLVSTRDSAGNETVITYNGLGQKIGMQDPNKGTLSYRYNSFGELINQIDAMGNGTVHLYDFKGRRTTELIGPPTGSTQPIFYSAWEYDRAPNGLGQINKETNATITATEFTRVTTFDALGRASTVETQFAGANGAMESHYQKTTYDQFGRVFQVFDAARTGADFTRNAIENVYNERGYLTNVKDASSGESLYQVASTDARGNARIIFYGNGETNIHIYDPRTGFLTLIYRYEALGTTQEYNATWDHLGNMTSRKDSLMGNTIETFHYDEHNRLARNTLGGTSVTINYDITDNITSKSDFEGGSTYEYHPTKVHAVKKVGSREYEYDDNGNVIQEKRNGAVAKTLTYNGKDQVTKITHNGHTSEFFYGSGNQRYKRIDTDSQGRRTTTLYIGSVEKIHYHDGVVEWKRQIGGIAQITHRVTNGIPNVGTRQYFHKDHLGSIAVITDGTGNVLQRMAFDPWGARRTINASNVWQPTAMSHSGILASYAKTAKPYTSRGYTGHEMLDEVGIVHMNGRIYDANLARFLQADPFIQAPSLAGSLNRYSYVMNNPMNAVDPSGYFFKKLKKELSRAWDDIRPYVGAIVGVALIYFTGGVGTEAASWFASSWYGAATAGAIAGAAGAAANGANLRGVLQGAALGAVSAAAFYGAGSAFAQSNCASCYTAGNALKTGAHVGKIATHAAVGGVMSVLQGGKFGHGFSAAGFAQAFAPAIGTLKGAKLMPARVAMAAAIGGTASKLSGGKFANGAITGAFSRLFNEELHESAQKGQSLEDYMQEKFGKLAITDEERGFAEAGDRKAFWTSRMERGDPIAKVALGIVNNESFVGYKYVGGRLANMFTGLEGDALNALGVDLMRAHIGAVDFDFNNKIGIPGLLSPTQAAAYHHEVFSTHGLGSWQFGGTLLNTSPNLMRAIWCTGCDHTGAAIR